MDNFGSFSIDKKSDIPIWVQLKQRLIHLIVSGTYQPGDQLPTVRELAVKLDINYHTVNKVYHDLESSKLIEVQAGRGSHVTDLGESRFIAFENEARMAVAEYAEKFLRLGMTAEEAIQAIADHLGISIVINPTPATISMEERVRIAR